MPVLSNVKWERFAQLVASGQLSDLDAYERAGYRRNRSAASRLSGNVNIRERVSELQAEVVERAIVDQTWVLEQLVKIAKNTQETKPGVATKALELIGKSFGMFVERHRHDFPPDERLERLARLMEENSWPLPLTDRN